MLLTYFLGTKDMCLALNQSHSDTTSTSEVQISDSYIYLFPTSYYLIQIDIANT